MFKRHFLALATLWAAVRPARATTPAHRRPLLVIREEQVKVDQPPPHGAIGMSTAYRISDAVPAPRAMEFRKRVLHVGAAIGLHPISHDEVYYVLSGEGEVTSDGQTQRMTAGMAAYLYDGAVLGIRQLGSEPLALIVSYPNPVAR